MDIATGLMMTCVALTQGVESPVGHVAAFDRDMADEPRQWLTDMAVAVQASLSVLERSEGQAQGPPKQTIYNGMRRLAQRGEGGRQ